MLDLSAVTLIDRAGLSIIFDPAEGSRRETSVVLRNPRGQVRRMLDLIGPPGCVVAGDMDEAEGAEEQVTA